MMVPQDTQDNNNEWTSRDLLDVLKQAILVAISCGVLYEVLTVLQRHHLFFQRTGPQ